MRPALALLGVLLCGSVDMVAAQRPQTREGASFHIGLGAGSLGCDDCDGRTNGLSGGLALARAVNQNIVLGLATAGWTKTEQGVTLTAGVFTAAIRLYPSASGGFFLLGGLGFGSIKGEISGFGNETNSGTGAILGLGYDIRIGDNVSLTPFLNGVGIATTDGGNANFNQIGLGITTH